MPPPRTLLCLIVAAAFVGCDPGSIQDPLEDSDMTPVGSWSVVVAPSAELAPSADYKGVWGTSATDVFVVGSYGTVARYDGNAWREETSGTTATLYGVWGTSSSDVFAVGSRSSWRGRRF